MIQFFKSWVLITRAYALPMSVFSWFVAYAYSIIDNGNSTYGLIALAGICLAHLGANMFDDFVDYHLLTKKYDKDNIDIFGITKLYNTSSKNFKVIFL